MPWLTDEEYAAEEIAKLERELRDCERARGDHRVIDELGMQRREAELRAEIDRLREDYPPPDDREEE